MCDMTLRERFIRSLKMERTDKVPVCSVTQTATVELMELSGASWPLAHYDAEKMATLAIAAYEMTGLEAVRYPFCTTAIAETLGCTIDKGTFDVQPFMRDFPCKTIEDIEKINIPEDMRKCKRVKDMLDAGDIIRKRVGEDVPLIAGTLGPTATAFFLAGANNFLRWCITDPDALTDLMEIGENACADFANALYEHGADAVVVIDSEAGPDLFPPPLFKPLVQPFYHSLTKKMNGLSILHMCGDASDILEAISETGFHGLSIEEKVDVAYAKQVVGGKMCLIGNVSPAATLLYRSTETIKKEAKQCIEDGVDILAPGCGIAPHTPLSNLKAFVAARDEYYKERTSA